MLNDFAATASIVVVLLFLVLSILVLGAFNVSQLSRTREMRENIRELRYYSVQVSHRANISLEEEAVRPPRRRMPLADFGGYWRDANDSPFSFPGHWRKRRR